MSINSKMTAIADEIRELSGTTGTMGLDDMASTLREIPKNDSTDLTASGATVTVPAGYYASQATKSVPTATQATPSIAINASGLITATATQTAGYVIAGTKSGTKQLTTQDAKTITPTKSSQTAVASGVYTTGAVTVGAIPSQYITTTDATASADEIMSGETAYVNGTKVTGTFSIDSELNTQDDLITQIQNAVNNLPDADAGGGGGTNIDTCIVKISITNNNANPVYIVMRYVNGEFVITNSDFMASDGIVQYNDVVCGSFIYVSEQDYICFSLNYSENLIPLEFWGFPYDTPNLALFKAPKEPNAVCTITLE